MNNDSLHKTVKYNCDVSDARDNGIYSICTLVLKLRNLYKWENGLDPWQEPDSPVLLDWIAAKEEYWETLQDKEFMQIPLNGEEVDPFLLSEIKKAVFFIAEILEEKEVQGCPTLILGNEKARELSSPFAMLQDDKIYIRREPLRFFFWDQIQEISPSCRISMQQALAGYGMLRESCSLDREKLIHDFDSMIDQELDIFIYHEVGESQEILPDGDILKKIVSQYPASVLELVVRSVKDILADTHPKGLLKHIINHEKKSSLGFYISFLDGMRKHLSPEIREASKQFWEKNDWSQIEKARQEVRKKNKRVAELLQEMCCRLDKGDSPDEVKRWAEKNILIPLGLHVPAKKEDN
jgi:hypothetical protein